MTTLAARVREFAAILTGRRGQDLPSWIATTRADMLPGFDSYLKGLDKDLGPAVAGLTVPCSNGPTEGVNTKIKLLKRQTYGKAVGWRWTQGDLRRGTGTPSLAERTCGRSGVRPTLHHDGGVVERVVRGEARRGQERSSPPRLGPAHRTPRRSTGRARFDPGLRGRRTGCPEACRASGLEAGARGEGRTGQAAVAGQA
ncbi:transposase [Micromonospora olivasterospora]|uniref:transposase n=1 Tax=Micromonospora olivasterospora TaxID=1880 RepID=UPI0011A27CD0